MSHLQRITLLLQAGHRRLFIPTTHDRQTLELPAQTAIDLGLYPLRWSAAHGLQDAKAVATDALDNAFRQSPPPSLTTAEQLGALRQGSQGRRVPAERPPAPPQHYTFRSDLLHTPP